MRATFIARVTGDDSPNRTATRAGVHGTDLGIMWTPGQGDVLVAFGDTYGEGWGGNGAGPASADWRKNVLARAPLVVPVTGLNLTEWVEDRPGHACQVLADDTSVREETVIPTAGIEHRGNQYMHAMSVRKWGEPGRWTTNYAALWSSPDGRSWTQTETRWDHPRRRWWQRHRPDGSRFQMGAFAPHGDHVLLFGTPAGRQGATYLARSLDMRVWEYWTGDRWQHDPGLTHPIMAGPTAELSVIHHRPTNQWLALTLDESQHAIVLRVAPEATGPWTVGEPILTAKDVPGLYGGYFHPVSADGDLYFTVSQWSRYQVDLYRRPVYRTVMTP